MKTERRCRDAWITREGFPRFFGSGKTAGRLYCAHDPLGVVDPKSPGGSMESSALRPFRDRRLFSNVSGRAVVPKILIRLSPRRTGPVAVFPPPCFGHPVWSAGSSPEY